MNNKLLKQFFDQEQMRIEVYKFFKHTLDEIALERVYKGEDTQGVKDAKEVLVRVERELQKAFVVKQPKKDGRQAE